MENKFAMGHVFIATSLDGYIARTDNSLDWLMKYDLNPDEGGFDEFTANMDAMLMGSGTFKTVLGFGQWPYKMHTYVMSGSMAQEEVPESLQDKVTIKNTAPMELMKELYGQGVKKVYVDGGKLIQSFLRNNLISEITLTQTPILIGKGKSLFGEIESDIDLELISSKPMKFGFIQNHYRVLSK